MSFIRKSCSLEELWLLLDIWMSEVTPTRQVSWRNICGRREGEKNTLLIQFVLSSRFSMKALDTIHYYCVSNVWIDVGLCLVSAYSTGCTFDSVFRTVQLKCDGTRWRTGEVVKRKLANGVGSQYSSHYLGTCCIQHYYRSCAHLGCHWSTKLAPPPI
jgi:hypothetical protein